jgi:hypothetical protein
MKISFGQVLDSEPYPLVQRLLPNFVFDKEIRMKTTLSSLRKQGIVLPRDDVENSTHFFSVENNGKFGKWLDISNNPECFTKLQRSAAMSKNTRLVVSHRIYFKDHFASDKDFILLDYDYKSNKGNLACTPEEFNARIDHLRSLGFLVFKSKSGAGFHAICRAESVAFDVGSDTCRGQFLKLLEDHGIPSGEELDIIFNRHSNKIVRLPPEPLQPADISSIGFTLDCSTIIPLEEKEVAGLGWKKYCRALAEKGDHFVACSTLDKIAHRHIVSIYDSLCSFLDAVEPIWDSSESKRWSSLIALTGVSLFWGEG